LLRKTFGECQLAWGEEELANDVMGQILRGVAWVANRIGERC